MQHAGVRVHLSAPSRIDRTCSMLMVSSWRQSARYFPNASPSAYFAAGPLALAASRGRTWCRWPVRMNTERLTFAWLPPQGAAEEAAVHQNAVGYKRVSMLKESNPVLASSCKWALGWPGLWRTAGVTTHLWKSYCH